MAKNEAGFSANVSPELISTIIDQSPLGYMVVNEKHEIEAYNKKASNILGSKNDIMLTRDILDPVLHTTDAKGSPFMASKHPVLECLETGKVVLGVVVGIWNEDKKQQRWISMDAQPINDTSGKNKGKLVLLRMTDITDSVRAKKEEEKVSERFRSLFDNMVEGAALHEVIFDKAGNPVNYRILDVNSNYEKHVGISARQAIGKLATDLYATDVPPYFAEFSAVAMSGTPYQFETYFSPLDKHFIISVAPLESCGFATIFFDISETKQLMAELERNNRELSGIVYAASHDLRSPLINIQGFISRLEKDCQFVKSLLHHAYAKAGEAVSDDTKALLDERVPKAFGYIKASVERMDRQIGGLLKISRAGRSIPNREKVDMNSLLAELISSFSFQLEKAGVKIEVDTLPCCSGDLSWLSQIFANLLDNAIKYRSPNRALSVQVSGIQKGSFVEYVVKDNGMGMENPQKAWQLFYRENPDDGLASEGIGLTMVERLVGRLGGKIELASVAREGSRFTIMLPI